MEIEKTERRLDEQIVHKHSMYKAEDLVKIRNNTKRNKLEPSWKGPNDIIDYLNNNNLQVLIEWEKNN